MTTIRYARTTDRQAAEMIRTGGRSASQEQHHLLRRIAGFYALHNSFIRDHTPESLYRPICVWDN